MRYVNRVKDGQVIFLNKLIDFNEVCRKIAEKKHTAKADNPSGK